MSHLTPEQLVDAAEGSVPVRVRGHLADCAGCRASVEELRAAIARAADVDVPEPSPLFWDHLSARVRAAIDSGESAPSRSWYGFGRASRWSLGLVACAALALLLIVAQNGRHPSSLLPAQIEPAVADTVADDPSLAFVSDLSADIDWDDAHDAGMIAHTGLMDRAVSELSASERVELGRLLREELTRGGA